MCNLKQLTLLHHQAMAGQGAVTGDLGLGAMTVGCSTISVWRVGRPHGCSKKCLALVKHQNNLSRETPGSPSGKIFKSGLKVQKPGKVLGTARHTNWGTRLEKVNS